MHSKLICLKANTGSIQCILKVFKLTALLQTPINQKINYLGWAAICHFTSDLITDTVRKNHRLSSSKNIRPVNLI